MSQAPVAVLIVYQAHPGKADDGLAALAALVATVVAQEPACLGITIHQDVSDPTRILLSEEWVDRASYVGPHMQTPHIRAFIERAPELFAGPPDISFWEQRGEARPG
jgi:quinol monooxygenase YgiN